MSDRVGQLLGNYKLIRMLGQGGFSDVYLAEHVHLGTYAAIKILHTQLAENNLESFRTEARTLAHLQHPNIVRVLDFGVIDTLPYLVMQQALNGTMRQRHLRGIPVALNVVVSYIKQMASALQYAHNQQIIHRDVKPENMLIGEQNQILLSDFGIAVVAAGSDQAGSHDQIGTAAYMAPELLQGKAVFASDQYALAIVVYEWLTGMPPFNGSYREIVFQQLSASPALLREKIPSLPSEVEEVIMIALNKDPQKRFGNIEAFAQALGLATSIKSDAVMQPKKPAEVSTMEVALIGPLGRTVLGATKVTIGRAPNNTLVLADPKVAAYHVELQLEGPYYNLVDLSNGYGTFVNEQPVYSGAPRMLQPGDMIRVGDTKFTFTMDNGAQRPPSGVYPPMPPMIPNQPSPSSPNQMVSTGYGMGNYPAGSPMPGQPSFYPNSNAQPTYITPQGSPAQQPGSSPNYGVSPTPPPSGYSPNYNGPQGSVSQSGYPPNYTGAQASLPPSRRRPSLIMIISGVIAVLIIIAGIIGFSAYHNNQVAQDNLHATATAVQTLAHNHATATVVVQQNATATVVTSINTTATAVATSPYPSFTKVALDDPLTTTGTDWNTSSNCKFFPIGYQASSSRLGYPFNCLNSGSGYGDIAYQVTMTIQQGDCGGLTFKYADAANFYYFIVCQDGVYLLARADNGKATLLSKNSTNSAIHTGLNASNLVAVTLQTDTINLYVNGTTLESVTDSSLMNKQGQIGVVVFDVKSPTAVSYTNALVWTT